MILKPIYTPKDFEIVAAINNLTKDPNKETGNNKAQEIANTLGITIHQDTEFTPVSLDYLINLYIYRAATREVTIQESKGTIRGNALEVTKLYPPTVENFLTESKINQITFNKILNLPEYQASIQRLKTFCTEKILSLTLLNQINSSISKLYLINISSLKDVSFIETNIVNNNIPKWMLNDNISFNNNNNIEEIKDIEYIENKEIPS